MLHSTANSFACFDPVVCSQILLYITPEEWRVGKPFLISKTFYTISISETFARDYLCETFQLSQDEQKQLEELIYNPPIFRESLMSLGGGGSSGEKRKRQEETTFEKRKNHEKSNCDDRDLSNPPTNFQQVFKWFLLFNDNSLYRNSKEKFASLVDNIYGEDFQFEKLYQIVDRMKAKRMINSNFEYFMEGSEISTEELGTIEISSDELRSIFTSVPHYEFIVDFTLDTSTSGKEQWKLKSLIFTSCGYPLVIDSEFESNLDMYRGMSTTNESFSIYGQEIFGNYLMESIQGFINANVAERINERAAELLSDILGKDFEKNLKEAGILYEDRVTVKYQLIYNYLQCTLGEYEKSLWKGFEEWKPFARFIREAIDEDSDDEYLDDLEEE